METRLTSESRYHENITSAHGRVDAKVAGTAGEQFLWLIDWSMTAAHAGADFGERYPTAALWHARYIPSNWIIVWLLAAWPHLKDARQRFGR